MPLMGTLSMAQTVYEFYISTSSNETISWGGRRAAGVSLGRQETSRLSSMTPKVAFRLGRPGSMTAVFGTLYTEPNVFPRFSMSMSIKLSVATPAETTLFNCFQNSQGGEPQWDRY